MTQREIFDSEKENFDRIYLYKEGVFWKAYERSAFHFCKHIAQFKPTKKFIKTAGSDIVSIGFPTATADKYNNKYSVVEQSETRMVLTAATITEAEFAEWKNAISYTERKRKIQTVPTAESEADIMAQIQGFDLGNRTPLECMAFVGTLQKQINA